MFRKFWEGFGVLIFRGRILVSVVVFYLFNFRDGYLFYYVSRFAFSGEVIVYFVRIEEKFFDVFWVVGCRVIFWDYSLEMGFYKRIFTVGGFLGFG